MLEIDKDYYCSANAYIEGTGECKLKEGCSVKCENFHRKYPTPEEFEAEYVSELKNDMPVFFRSRDCEEEKWSEWILCFWNNIKYMYLIKNEGNQQVIVACTPFGYPPEGWRPE